MVHCDGALGVLARRGGVWSVDNESELRVLAALGRGGGALRRAKALAAALNAGLVEAGDIGALNRIVGMVRAADDRAVRWSHGWFLPALCLVCAVLADRSEARWLGWALSARLDANLVRMWLPGPGLMSFEAFRDRRGRIRAWGYDREVRWLAAMPPEFWELLDRCDRCKPAGEAFCVAPRPDEMPCLRALRTASDPATKPAVLRDLAATKDKTVLDMVASHPNTPAKTLLAMSTNPWSGDCVKWRTAQNKKASPWLLQRLSKHHSPVLRAVAATHPNMAQRSLERLAGDTDALVRAMAARHPETPAPMLGGLAEDPDTQVRANTAAHPSCPPDALKRLLGDRLGAVRAAAVSNPLTPPHKAAAMARDRAIAVRAAVAYRTDTDTDTLDALAGDDKWRVRSAAAENHNTPPQTLARLARDPIAQVRHHATTNPSLPGGALAELARDDDFWVRAAAAASPALPPSLAEALAADPDPHVRYKLAPSECLSPAALERLAGDEVWFVRAAAADNPATPETALAALAQDHEAEVRAAAASHPNTPQTALRQLSRDADYRARFEARHNLNQRKAARRAKTRRAAAHSQQHQTEQTKP